MNKCLTNSEKWYVLYTAPRAEKQVDQRLKKEGITTFLPLHLSPRRWSDRIKLIEVPLFSSYIFIYTAEFSFTGLLQCRGCRMWCIMMGSRL